MTTTIFGRLADQLVTAYRTTHDEEAALAGVTDDQAVVLQAIRMRITPALFLSSQFEATLQTTVPIDQYYPACSVRELRRLRRLSASQLEQLYEQLMQAEGYVWTDGQWVAHPEGHGELAAYVFDPLTGQAMTRSGIGVHHLIVHSLYDQIRPREIGHRFTTMTRPERIRDFTTRMVGCVAGFIVRLPGWTAPFLHLWDKEPELPWAEWRGNVRLVESQRLFLIVQHSGQPLPR